MDILLVEDHPIVRDGLKRLLSAMPAVQVREETTGRGALAAVRVRRPDLMILDLNLPDIGGLDVLGRLKREDSTVPVLVLTMHCEPIYAVRALEAGARGYLSKGAAPDELMAAIKAVGKGGRYVENAIAQAIVLKGAEASGPLDALSARDLEVLRLLAGGHRLAEVADRLQLAYKTVANITTGIKRKLGVSTTMDLVRLAVELNSV
ncbi:MAG TPA: response regulator transcription factor [Caulobacteraceae bacterium]|nr:response regulator transcription factor [Caulobacteraceae bacterium]